MDEVMKLKAEIFDLQIEMATAKDNINKRLKRLNILQGDNGKVPGRILPENERKGTTDSLSDKRQG